MAAEEFGAKFELKSQAMFVPHGCYVFKKKFDYPTSTKEVVFTAVPTTRDS